MQLLKKIENLTDYYPDMNYMDIFNVFKIRFKKKNVDLVRYCLRLFRTKNGEPEGPDSTFFIGEDQEWT